MNCQEFEHRALDLMRGGAPEDAMQLHASGCARCAAREAEAGQLMRGLQQLAQADQRAHAPARLEANLRAALRQQNPRCQPRVSRLRAFFQPWSFLPQPLMAAAVVALTVLLPVGLWRSGVASGTPALVAALSLPPTTLVWAVPDKVAQPTPKPTPPPELKRAIAPPRVALQPVALRVTPARDKVKPKPQPEVSLNHAPEVVTQFFPLEEAAGLPPTDELHLVRVQLPRSTLANFGLPVNEQNSARVTADVLIGADGLARAVRFVR